MITAFSNNIKVHFFTRLFRFVNALKLVNIKGYIKHTSYDKKYFNFQFQETYHDNDYIDTIKHIYNNYAGPPL